MQHREQREAEVLRSGTPMEKFMLRAHGTLPAEHLPEIRQFEENLDSGSNQSEHRTPTIAFKLSAYEIFGIGVGAIVSPDMGLDFYVEIGAGVGFSAKLDPNATLKSNPSFQLFGEATAAVLIFRDQVSGQAEIKPGGGFGPIENTSVGCAGPSCYGPGGATLKGDPKRNPFEPIELRLTGKAGVSVTIPMMRWGGDVPASNWPVIDIR